MSHTPRHHQERRYLSGSGPLPHGPSPVSSSATRWEWASHIAAAPTGDSLDYEVDTHGYEQTSIARTVPTTTSTEAIAVTWERWTRMPSRARRGGLATAGSRSNAD